MFLKLTGMGDGVSHWMNMNRIERIIPHGKGGAALFYAAEQSVLYVNESPEEIMRAMNEQAKRGKS